MENQIPTDTPPVTNQPSQVPVTRPNNWVKIVSFLVLAVILMGGSVFAGIQIGKNQSREITPPVPTIPPVAQQVSPTSAPVTPSNTPYPTTDTTANWKTYNGGEFTIKYPTDWEVRNLKSSDLAWLNTSTVYLGLAPIAIKEDVLGSIRVTTDSLNQVISDTKSQRLTPGTPSRLVSEENTLFNGYQATKLVFENTVAQVKDTSYLISRNNKTYVIGGGGTQDTSTIDSIIATFRFTQ